MCHLQISPGKVRIVLQNLARTSPSASAETATSRPRTAGSGFGGTNTVAKRVSLQIPAGVPIEAWRRLGRDIQVLADSSAWWLGDWLVYGQHHYPDRYRQALEETGLEYQTLRNYAWVARRFAPDCRNAKLSFQHHAEVASLPAAERQEWLAQAEGDSWSRNELRRQIQASRANRDLAEPIHIRMSPSEQQRVRWQAAAETINKDLVGWIADTLDAAAADLHLAVEPDGPSQLSTARA
ncbi:LmbU family transcriptional regulator [Rhodococcus qingshengii]|uniref:LmbU family transcriptional regulator n=1 Tax=Rhodococcus qingshengii TaxID=334542 RepID=UPI0036DAFCA8